MTDQVDRILQQWAEQRPDLDVAPIGLIGRLHRLAQTLTEELTAVFRQHGLAEGEFDVLCGLRRQGPPYALTPGELAASTMVTTGGMSKRLDRLEAGGLVRRRSSDQDGRSRVVELTPAGLTLCDETFTAHVANEHRLVEGLSEQEQATLVDLLTRWSAAVAAAQEPDDGTG